MLHLDCACCHIAAYFMKCCTLVFSFSTSSIDGWRFDEPPPYQYPLHLVQSHLPVDDELILEPATASTLL